MKNKKKYKALKALETIDTKACSICLTIKPLDDFSRDPKGRRGLQARCKFCFRGYDRKERAGKGDAHTIKWLELRDQEGADEKVCKKCLIIKPLSAFQRCQGESRARKGYTAVCKQCTNAKRRAERIYDPRASRQQDLKYKYGLTIARYDEMLENQGSCCDICGTDTPGSCGRFVVDHCHETGQVRALLCQCCNVVLGMAKDNPETLREAARYLEIHDGN